MGSYYFLDDIFVHCATSWISEAKVNILIGNVTPSPGLELFSLVKYLQGIPKKLGTWDTIALLVLSFKLSRTRRGDFTLGSLKMDGSRKM